MKLLIVLLLVLAVSTIAAKGATRYKSHTHKITKRQLAISLLSLEGWG